MEPSHESLALIRRAAPALCREMGVPLPGELLSLGLPDASTPAEKIDSPVRSIEDLVSTWVRRHPDRRRSGLYLTPAPIAEKLLAEAWDREEPPRTVLDPAAGAGAFLMAARKRWGAAVALHGVDVDPAGVALARLSLWIAAAEGGRSPGDPLRLVRAIRWGDALLQPDLWTELRAAGGVDLVCGNPPFGNAIEKRTSRSEEERTRLRRLFPEAARGPYDRSVLFVRLAAGLVGGEGRLAVLVPRALLAARYAAPLREWLEDRVPLDRAWIGSGEPFVPDAEIGLVGLICRRGKRSAAVSIRGDRCVEERTVPRTLIRGRSWGGLLHPLAEALEGSAGLHPPLAERFEVRAAAAVGEAYRIVGDLRDGGEGWRFLTAGLIRRHHDLWGRKPARHLGRRLERPVLPHDAPAVSARRRELYARPKLIVSGLSVRLRARRDEEGARTGAIGTLLVLPRACAEAGIRLLRRADLLLNSIWLSELHRCRNGPASLAGGNLPLGRRDLEELPFPRILAEAELEAADSGDLGFLDAEASRIDGGDPIDAETDRRVQEAILRIAGIDPSVAERLLRDATAPRPARAASPRRGS